jgi:glycosyltransferase involved in cell wall biosynthesis
MLGLILTVWLAATIVALLINIGLGLAKIRYTHSFAEGNPDLSHSPPLDIIVPLKGVVAGQEDALRSLLEQNYPDYGLIFVLESENDTAHPLVDKLLQRYSFARKVIGGVAVSCAQKNHSLLAGLKEIRPSTEILVFCDSTNRADPGWLQRLTEPLRNGDCQVVTTFRVFHPDPETLGGVCQAIYASFIRLLAAIKPKPWGGATVIRRETFERLHIPEVWSRTVVDDLILGNVLDRAGIEVRMDPHNLLESPLYEQSVKGFLSYLDRQILFPKFTNPGIWVATLLFHINLTLAVIVAVLVAVLFPVTKMDDLCGWSSYGFLAATGMCALLLRRTNHSPVSIRCWLMAFFPCILLSAFVFLRSIFRSHIDWHGRRYWPGGGGVVLRTEFETERTSFGS